jgi:hypothetical protein
LDRFSIEQLRRGDLFCFCLSESALRDTIKALKRSAFKIDVDHMGCSPNIFSIEIDGINNKKKKQLNKNH